jgi:hypothetical protein
MKKLFICFFVFISCKSSTKKDSPSVPPVGENLLVKLIFLNSNNNKFYTNKTKVKFSVEFNKRPSREVVKEDFILDKGKIENITKESTKRTAVDFLFDARSSKEQVKLTFKASAFNKNQKDIVWNLYYDKNLPIITLTTSKLYTDKRLIYFDVDSTTAGVFKNTDFIVENAVIGEIKSKSALKWQVTLKVPDTVDKALVKVWIKKDVIKNIYSSTNVQSNKLEINYDSKINTITKSFLKNIRSKYYSSRSEYEIKHDNFDLELNFSKGLPVLYRTDITGVNANLSNMQKISDTKYTLSVRFQNPTNFLSLTIPEKSLLDKSGLKLNQEFSLKVRKIILAPVPDINLPANASTVNLDKDAFLKRKISYAQDHDGNEIDRSNQLYSIDVPYSPFAGKNGPDTTLIFEYITTSANAFFSVKFPKSLIAKLPDNIKDLLREDFISDVDIYFVIQDAPGIENAATGVGYDQSKSENIPAVKAHYLIHSWEFPGQDLPERGKIYAQPIRSSIFDTHNGYLAEYYSKVKRDIQDDSISIHTEDDKKPNEPTIFSGPTGQIKEAKLLENYAFWSVVISEKHARAAVTLHWIIVNKLGDMGINFPTDIDFENKDLKDGFFTPKCAPPGNDCTLEKFIEYLNNAYPVAPGNDLRKKTRKIIDSLIKFIE